MKLQSFALVCALAVPAFLNATTTTPVYSDNEFGLLQVSSSLTNTAISIPWGAFGVGDAAISVSNIVKTATLKAGDKCYVYNGSGNKYDVFTLEGADGSVKTWKAGDVVTIAADGTVTTFTANGANATTKASGLSIWLYRQDPANCPIYLYGQVITGTVTTVVSAGTAAEPVYNLIASPGTSAFDLNGGKIGTGVTASTLSATAVTTPGDQISVMINNSGKLRSYYYNGTAWGYFQRNSTTRLNEFVITNCTIPAGQGFWYVSRGGSPTIQW